MMNERKSDHNLEFESQLHKLYERFDCMKNEKN